MGNKIAYSSSKVNATKVSVKSAFEDLENVVKEMKAYKEKIPSFWESEDAKEFCKNMDNVEEMIDKFNAKYSRYMEELDNVYEAFSKSNSDFLATIQSLKGTND